MASDEKIDASASNAASNEPKTLWRRISDCFWYCDSSVFMIIFGLFPLILGIVIAEPYFGRTAIPPYATFEGNITKSIYLEPNKTYTLYAFYGNPHCSIVDSKGNNLPAETWEPNEHYSFIKFYNDFEQVRPTKSDTYKFF